MKLKLKGRLRLDLDLRRKYFEIETIIFTIDSKGTLVLYCAYQVFIFKLLLE